MTVEEEKLMAYADGELTGAERSAVEAAIAADPVLAGKVAAHRSLRGALAGAFDPVLSEALPPGLVARAGAGSREVMARPSSPAAAPVLRCHAGVVIRPT